MDTALSSCGVAMVTSIVRTAQTRPIAVSTAGPTVPQSPCVLPFPALGGVLASLVSEGPCRQTSKVLCVWNCVSRRPLAMSLPLYRILVTISLFLATVLVLVGEPDGQISVKMASWTGVGVTA